MLFNINHNISDVYKYLLLKYSVKWIVANSAVMTQNSELRLLLTASENNLHVCKQQGLTKYNRSK